MTSSTSAVASVSRYLCDYLDPSASYEGFDIMEQLIDWCQADDLAQVSEFPFPIRSAVQLGLPPRPIASLSSRPTIPLPADSFDFAFAHSVFTHLSPEASANYLQEIHRVLRPGGISYSTWFLFDEDPSASVSPLIAGMTLNASGDFALHNPEVPDTAVGYRESFVRSNSRCLNYRSANRSIPDSRSSKMRSSP